MKILLLGANGQVGHEARRSLASLGEVICATRSGRLDDGTACERVDLNQPASLHGLVDAIAPDVVVNAAAYTAVDQAEDDRDAAFRVNAEAPGWLAEVCARRDILLVHYSTDYVFDGSSSRPYREDDSTVPLGVYGASKRAGEEVIYHSGCRHLIFRTAWVYASHGKNFLRTLLRLGAECEELKIVSDQIGTPTSARLIADVTAEVLPQLGERSGIWHLTALGQTSWHGFAEAIFEEAEASHLLERRPRVMPISTSEYSTRARRPAYSRLDTTRLQSDFNIVLSDWRQGVVDVMQELAASKN